MIDTFPVTEAHPQLTEIPPITGFTVFSGPNELLISDPTAIPTIINLPKGPCMYTPPTFLL